MELYKWAIVVLFSGVVYAIGLPFGRLLAEWKGKTDEILKTGSGSFGATNISRALGKTWGRSVLLIDCLKAIIAVSLIYFISVNVLDVHPENETVRNWLKIILSASCILGNIFPAAFNFKGGKAVATSLGIVFTINVMAALIGFFIFTIVFSKSKQVSLGSLFGTYSAFLTSVFYYIFGDFPLLFLCSMIGIFLIVTLTHWENISRLLNGREHASNL